MSWIPPDWETSRASGYFEFHYLTHTPCGWTSHNYYDLVLDLSSLGRQQAKNVVYSHRCDGED
jgi:hypothetical protein